MTGSLITALAMLTLVAASAGVYLLPTLIGYARHVPNLGSIAVVNILLGWTLAGWVVALAMATRSVTQSGPVVQLIQNAPPPLTPSVQPTPPFPHGPMPPGWPAHPSGPAAHSNLGSDTARTRRTAQAPPLIVPPRSHPGPAEAPGPDDGR